MKNTTSKNRPILSLPVENQLARINSKLERETGTGLTASNIVPLVVAGHNLKTAQSITRERKLAHKNNLPPEQKPCQYLGEKTTWGAVAQTDSGLKHLETQNNRDTSTIATLQRTVSERQIVIDRAQKLEIERLRAELDRLR